MIIHYSFISYIHLITICNVDLILQYCSKKSISLKIIILTQRNEKKHEK